MPTPWIDSHCHLYFERFDEDRDDVIARARDEGCVAITNIGIDVPTTEQAIALAEAHPGFCFATSGLHPTETEMPESDLERIVQKLEELARTHANHIRAIGEIGLDYYWDKATPEAQKRAFRRQLDLAESLSLPVVIHCRDALDDALEIVAEYAPRVRGVFHCFGGGAPHAARVIELGWWISFAGNVTFPKAHELREAAAVAPLDRLLLETDAPFLAPQAVRGARNEPVYALHTGDFLAEQYGIAPEELRQRTTDNARALFAI